MRLAATEAPFPVEPVFRVVPAPRPLGAAPHVVLDDAWPAALERRLARLRDDRDGVLVRSPGDSDDPSGLDGALVSAWRLLPCPRVGDVVVLPHLAAEVDLRAKRARATGPEVRGQAELLATTGTELLAVGWLLASSDDLVVLRRTGPGALAAELLAVAFPSGWSPRRRAGASLAELHEPVADGQRLLRATAALSEALLTKGPYVQHVWGLDPSGRLDHDPSAPDARPPTSPPPQDWWLRVERQTSLPLGDRALFTIRPYLTPLADLTRDQQRTLAAAVRSLSPAARAYKGVPDGLAEWLSSASGRPDSSPPAPAACPAAPAPDARAGPAAR